MNVAVILGTRPEAIRLFHTIKRISPKWVMWTGQNYSKNLSKDILSDPRFEGVYDTAIKYTAEPSAYFETQVSRILLDCFSFLKATKPEKVLVLGDTNSALAASIATKNLGIPLYHMESGNRCNNPKSPEELNRRMIDSIADVHLCYTDFSKQNLIQEGVPLNKIHVIGNPIAEFQELRRCSTNDGYILVDLHRAENSEYLHNIDLSLAKFKDLCRLVLHPRFYEYFKALGYNVTPSTNFSTFVELEKGASLIVTDSGTVCEEATLLWKKCLIVRETMERPELLEAGNTVLRSPSKPFFDTIAELLEEKNTFVDCPYKVPFVSLKVQKILQSTPNEYK